MPAVKPAVLELPEASVEAPLSINLRIYNYLGLPPRALARVKKESSRFFQDVGIEMVWVECAPSAADAEKFPGCPEQLEPVDLVLRLLPRFPSKRKGFRDTLFGYAAGFQASIVYNRIEEIA